jgi:hypothetical protein
MPVGQASDAGDRIGERAQALDDRRAATIELSETR